MSQRTGIRDLRAPAALGAVSLSLVIHALLIGRMPPIPLGRVEDPRARRDYPSIVLRDVVPEVAPPSTAPARYRPENSAEVIDALESGISKTPLGSDLLEWEPPEPAIRFNPVKGEAQALKEPPPVEPRPIWDPRAEILQITDRIVDDAFAALPRRFMESVDRAALAPDVTLPMDLATDYAFLADGSDEAGLESPARPIGWPEGWGDALLEALERAPTQDRPPFTIDPLLAEEAFPTEAIEEDLAIETTVFREPGGEGYTYVRFSIRPHPQGRLPVLPKDILILQDCSESMTPARLAIAKRGLRRWLELMGPQDRFQIIAFRDRVEYCFAEPWQSLNEQARRQALAFIENMRSAGNTDIFGSLSAASALPRDSRRPFLAFLITDGRPTVGMTRSSEIIEAFSRQNNGRLAMFAIGSGRRANRFLLDLLSYRNRGDSLIVQDDSLLASAMERWAIETRRPILSDLRYRFSGIPTEDIYPRALTPLFLDRALVLYGRIRAVDQPIAFQIAGASGENQKDMVFSIDLNKASVGGREIRTNWAWHRMFHLISEHTRTGSPELIEEIRLLAREHGLPVPYGFGEFVIR